MHSMQRKDRPMWLYNTYFRWEMLEELLLRLNEQGLEVSSPWVLDQEQLLVEVLWPRLHQAWREKERWDGCRELDTTVQDNWEGAKLCLQALRKLGRSQLPL